MPTRDRLAEITAGTHAIIDLDAYASNIQELRRRAGQGRQLMAIVKANAYGHGAVECGLTALQAGASSLGVARIDEALELRRAGLDGPILVIGPPNVAQVDLAIEHDIALTVATEDSYAAVVNATDRLGTRATVHLKVDTGLHRYGALPTLAIDLAQRLYDAPGVDFQGIYTHYSSADERDPEPTLEQIRVMRGVLDELKARSITPPFVHIANSAGILESHFPESNLVRAGIATYGLDPSDEVPVDDVFRQVLTLHSIVTRRFILEAGESVSYNRTYTAQQDEQVASAPIGYADGIERHLSNAGWFMVNGERCPIIGRVCMDQTVIKAPVELHEGDTVTVIGDGTDGAMTVADVGRLSQTNTYEPVVRIAARVPRIYVQNKKPVSWWVPILGERGAFEQ